MEPGVFRRSQRGITTLAVTLILLVIVTLMVIFASSVGFFEQKTATNENRARIAGQAAEYALNLAGEYLKANRSLLISDTGTGWFSAANPHWARCGDVGYTDSAFPAGHPCLSERDTTATTTYPHGRRAALYFWTLDGTTGTARGLPYTDIIPASVRVEHGLGGTAAFPASTEVNALLCRLDTSDASNVHCALDPVAGNRIALYLISKATLTDESSSADVKESWATYSSFVPGAAVSLIASGYVQGLGNGQIVPNPNGGGYGLPASIWSPNDVDVDATGTGVGSVSTCQIGDFLKDTPEAELKTTCATSNTACGCDASSQTGTNYLSGHAGSIKREREDILDVDANNGSLPDITYFPGKGMDTVGDNTDDSLFEYTFNPATNVVTDNDATGTTLTNCGSGAQNCFDYVMREEFDPTIVADCSGLNGSSSGIIYVTGPCTSLPSVIGSVTDPAIVVINQGTTEMRLNGPMLFYGMLFLHSDSQGASLKGSGNATVFGSVVVEGNVNFSGNLTIVYDDTSISSDPHKLPSSAKFGRVPGSWLDSRTAF